MNHPQPQPPFQGRSVLYLPHRLFAESQEALSFNDSPVPPNHLSLPQFPFPIPYYLNNGALRLRSHALRKAEYSTSIYSTTRPSSQTLDLQDTQNEALRFVYASRRFWPNLVRYAGYPNATQPHTTWTNTAAEPIPDSQQQIQAIRGLAAWYLFHLNRKFNVPEMNSEPSVQGEVILQILEPINALLKTRYLPPTHYNQHDDNSSLRYPRWGRGINVLHRSPGAQPNSGFPDFLYHRFGTQTGNNGATGEVKTFWSYPSTSLLQVFIDGTVSSRDGRFAYQGNIMSKLLLQMWGQLCYFDCHLGFWTNGERVMFLARSGPNDLILSEPKLWTDPEVHAAFAGLSFAANDIFQTGPQYMVDLLCPPNVNGVNGRRPSWWFL